MSRLTKRYSDPPELQAYIRLHNVGVRFRLDGETLRAGPSEVVSDEYVTKQIKRHRDGIVRLIKEAELERKQGM